MLASTYISIGEAIASMYVMDGRSVRTESLYRRMRTRITSKTAKMRTGRSSMLDGVVFGSGESISITNTRLDISGTFLTYVAMMGPWQGGGSRGKKSYVEFGEI